MSRNLLVVLFVIVCSFANAQTTTYIYDNKTYNANIKTVECYNSKKEQSIPIIALKSSETITLGFDDLEGGGKNYSYTIEHCTFDWKPSKINTLLYVETFDHDIITNYRYSFNTLQKFTHYEVTLPNDQVKPKLAGNYLLRVYEGNNTAKPVLTQRFYVVNNTLNVGAEVVQSTDVEFRTTKQKLNFTIFNQFPIQNPSVDVKAVVMQNFISATAVLNTKPMFIKQTSLVYNELNANEFWGGNEFRKFDTRSFRYKAASVNQIYLDSLQNVVLATDLPNDPIKYSNSFDENGNFFIRNNDGRDNVTDSDYANVLFTLNAAQPTKNGDVYVVGRFNNYTLSDENKLTFESSRRRFYGNIKLKQGIYDYKYIWVDNTQKFNDAIFEASFFETENNYQVFVYYRRPGSRFDELAGFVTTNSVKK